MVMIICSGHHQNMSSTSAFPFFTEYHQFICTENTSQLFYYGIYILVWSTRHALSTHTLNPRSRIESFINQT